MDQLWTEDETAARLGGLPKKTLAQWRYLKKGPVWIRVGRYVRYRPADVEAWISSQVEVPKGSRAS